MRDATSLSKVDSTFLWSWAARRLLLLATLEDSRGAGCRGGDVLQVARHGSSPVSARCAPVALDSLVALREPLRVTKGAQQDWFGPEAFESYSPARTSSASSRIARACG